MILFKLLTNMMDYFHSKFKPKNLKLLIRQLNNYPINRIVSMETPPALHAKKMSKS